MGSCAIFCFYFFSSYFYLFYNLKKKNHWNWNVGPTLAFRCRKLTGRSTTGGKSSSRTEKGSRQVRIPFHKRLSNGQQLSNKNLSSNQIAAKTAAGQPQAVSSNANANSTCTSTITVTTSTSNNTIENNFTTSTSSSQRFVLLQTRKKKWKN